MRKYGIYLGRFSPIHQGHVNVISKMLKEFDYCDSLILIGSCASKLDKKLFFTYLQRKKMILALFPKINIVGLPDFKDADNDPRYCQWHENLWDIIKLKFPNANKNNVVFFSGSEEDAFFYKNEKYIVEIVDRHDKNNFSASEIREQLLLEYYDEYKHDLSYIPRPLNETCYSSLLPMIKEFFIENQKIIYESMKDIGK